MNCNERDVTMESTMRKKTTITVAARTLLVAFVLLLLSSVVNWGLVTDWGSVRVERLTLMADNGLRYSALMYVPETATNETPAPGVVFYHGNSGNARNHEAQAIEYARRGFVCISADNNGGGDSEFADATGNDVAARIFTDYFIDLNIVDAERLVFTGHSMGGDKAVVMAVEYQPNALLISDNGGMGEELGGNFGNVLYVNGGSDELNPTDIYRKRAADRFRMNGLAVEEELAVPDKLYGSFEEGNAGMLVEIPGQLHEGAIVNSAHLAAMLDFTMNCFEVPNPIDANDQVWVAANVAGQAGMFAFVFFLCALALYLIEKVPAFAIVKQPMPRNIGLRGIGMGISLVAAIGFPVASLYTGCFGLLDLIGGRRPNFALLPVKYTNFALAIVISLNIFGLVMFFVYHFTDGKKHQAKLYDYGLTTAGSTKISWELIGKSALLAAIVVAVGWTYLSVQQGLLGTDFYAWYWGYKPIAADKFRYYIPYILLWAVCFTVAALGMCVERRLPSTGKEWLDTLIAVVFNGVLATAAITTLVLTHAVLQSNAGSSVGVMNNWGVDMTRIWGMPVGMFIGGAGNTYCYRKTGNIWLGAFLMGTVCALSACLYGQIAF